MGKVRTRIIFDLTLCPLIFLFDLIPSPLPWTSVGFPISKDSEGYDSITRTKEMVRGIESLKTKPTAVGEAPSC